MSDKQEGITKVYRPGGETPYDIPQEVFWDKTKDANIRRGQWVVDNCPDVTVDEIQFGLVMQPNEVDQLDLSSRSVGEESSTNEEDSSESIAMCRALLRGNWQDVINPRTRKGDIDLHEQLLSDPFGTYAKFAEKLRSRYPEFTDTEFRQEFHKALLSAIDHQLYQNKVQPLKSTKYNKPVDQKKSLQVKNAELEHLKEIFETDEEQPK